MNGKSKCKILKDIRREIARSNNIEFVTSECKFQGDCTGTCPKCEAEVRYLEQELKKRQAAGRAVAVAGIAASLVVSAAGCSFLQRQTTGDVPYYDPGEQETIQATCTTPSEEEPVPVPAMGEPAATEEELLQGAPEPETTWTTEEELILMGDVPFEE